MENTLEAALKQWKEREQRYEKLFSPPVLKSREFLREKLRHFDTLRAGVMAGTIKEDRLAMRALELERKQLARLAYPNRVARILNRITSGLRLDNDIVKIRQQSMDNTEKVRTAMEKAGLAGYFGLAENQMKQGIREFSVPVSYHVGEQERMDLQVNFKKDEGGNYVLENYKASLYNEEEKGRPKQHTFSHDSNALNTSQAYNLLAGRAVYNNGSWQQLDFNDRDAGGNYRIKHFRESYGFDIEKALAALPLKEDSSDNLLSALRNGEKCAVTLSVGNKEANCRIVANPQQKEVGIYNEAGQKTTLPELNKKETVHKSNILKMLPKVETGIKQKGKSVKI
jgi:hypothetical protein